MKNSCFQSWNRCFDFSTKFIGVLRWVIFRFLFRPAKGVTRNLMVFWGIIPLDPLWGVPSKTSMSPCRWSFLEGFPQKIWNYIVHCFIAWVGFLYNDPFLKIGVFDDFLQAKGAQGFLKKASFFFEVFPHPSRHLVRKVANSTSATWEVKQIWVDKEAFWTWTFYFFWFPTKGGDVEAVYIFVIYIYIFVYIYTYLDIYILYNVYIYIYICIYIYCI